MQSMVFSYFVLFYYLKDKTLYFWQDNTFIEILLSEPSLYTQQKKKINIEKGL